MYILFMRVFFCSMFVFVLFDLKEKGPDERWCYAGVKGYMYVSMCFCFDVQFRNHALDYCFLVVNGYFSVLMGDHSPSSISNEKGES